MGALRVLITNKALTLRGGVQTHIRDLAAGLLARGHQPVVYSTELGAMARELRSATVPVVDDLDELGVIPDIIHGNSTIETMTALHRFPDTPAVFVCHGWWSWYATPPLFPRVLRYVAVDDTCRDRMLLQNGVDESRTVVIRNAVDLERFTHREPLPPKPIRAAVFGNFASELTHIDVVRRACEPSGIEVDAIGWGSGNAVADPESLLGTYDLVFAKAKCALESLATGCAVVLCDAMGMGPMVTTAELDRLRRLNFGVRALDRPLSVEALRAEIARYDPADAARVCDAVRTMADINVAVEEFLSLYETVIAEHRSHPADRHEERQATARFLAWISRRLGENTSDVEQIAPVVKLATRVLRTPVIGPSLRWLGNRLAGRPRLGRVT
jgi:hypothetical protein